MNLSVTYASLKPGQPMMSDYFWLSRAQVRPYHTLVVTRIWHLDIIQMSILRTPTEAINLSFRRSRK